jgi:hypothetical protein
MVCKLWKGNLLLEFGKKEQPVILKQPDRDEDAKNFNFIATYILRNMSHKMKDISSWLNSYSTTPTDEEIKEKAATYAKTQHETPAEMLNSIDQYDREHVMMIEQSIEDSRKDYLFGYKQALKDLGYADN